MSYTAPTEEQRFLLDHIAQLPGLAASDFFASATPDMVEAILEGAAALAEGEFAPLNRIGDNVGARWDKGVVQMPAGFKQAYDAFVEGGWGTLAAPAEHGGQAMPFALSSAVFESLGGANMAFGLIFMLSGGAIEAIAAHASPEIQARWLPRLVTGEWNATMNLTEPQAGSDVGALKTMATLDDRGVWRIRGEKIFITFGEHDLTDNILHLVLARTPDAPAGTKGISLFLVPKFRADAHGDFTEPNDVRCISIEHKLGIHASPTCAMVFGEDGDCRGELIGDLHGGMKAMFTMMNNARINVGNQGVQIAEAATQQARSFAHERIQSAAVDGSSGRMPVPIIRHPDVRRMLLRMMALTQGARALVYYAAGLADRAHRGDAQARARVGLITPLAKAWGTDVGCEVASLGVQVHGGMGFVEETGAAQHYRDARISPIYEGSNGIQAIDLVLRKLRGDSGAAFRPLLDEIEVMAQSGSLLAELAGAVRETGEWMMADGDINARLMAAYPFLTMFSVLVAGWLFEQQLSLIDQDHQGRSWSSQFISGKKAAAKFFTACIVPEAVGLRSSVLSGVSLCELEGL
jgi:alkylation response protein AidB-like acyl-CoA dehydrogenase